MTARHGALLLGSTLALGCPSPTSPAMTDTQTEGSTGTTAEPSPDTDTDTIGESEDTSAGTVGETTGPMPCERHEQCTEPLLPLCGPDGLCVSCDELPEPDAACAELDPMAPLCVGGQCVQCSEQDATACDGMLCDAETNSCYPCTAHDQCGEAACNLFTGQCLPEDEVVHVGTGFPYDRIDDAVESFNSPGDQGTIIVHGSGVYSDQFVVIGNAQTIAILANDGDLPQWDQNTAVPHLRVVVDATVLVDGMQISGSPGGPGVEVDGGRLWIDRGRIIDNNGGGVVVAGADEQPLTPDLVLRNCFVGRSENNIAAVDVYGATAQVSYSTIIGGTGSLAEGLRCTVGSTVSVRNTIVLIESDNPPVACDGATFVHSVSEIELPGPDEVVDPGNVNTGDFSDVSGWFINTVSGDFGLSGMHPVAIDTAAQWTSGDPPTDIDGDPRPTTDGAMDFAGADVP